jgi:hypothetical protein
MESRPRQSDWLKDNSGSIVSTPTVKGTYRTEARLGAVDNDLAMIDDRVERDAARIACLAGVLSIVSVCIRWCIGICS